MEFKGAYESCKYLVLKYGYANGDGRDETVSDAIYLDPCDCDFRIYYCRLPDLINDNGEKYEIVQAYIGGRCVYYYDAWASNEKEEYFVKGNWYDLTFALRDYYGCKSSEKFIWKEHTLIQLCKKEAERNRTMLKKYFDICHDILLKNGLNKSTKDDRALYKYRELVGGKVVEIESAESLCKSEHDHNRIDMLFEGKKVFWYRWGGSIGSRWDNLGFYEVGSWEEAIQDIHEKL